jgi:hypothetical protein
VDGLVAVAEEDTLGVQNGGTGPSAAVVGTNQANGVLKVAAQEIVGVVADMADELREVHTEAPHCPHNFGPAAVGTQALVSPPLAIEAATNAQRCGVDLAGAVCSEASGPEGRARC